MWEIEYAVSGSGVVRGELRLLGTCKGHKRGVWSVRFGKAERVLATGSGDKTVKMWSLDDFSCVKTFEGHTDSVLRVDFINAGKQMVSAASDGLVKLWNVRAEECTATMDNHEDKVGVFFIPDLASANACFGFRFGLSQSAVTSPPSSPALRTQSSRSGKTALRRISLRRTHNAPS